MIPLSEPLPATAALIQQAPQLYPELALSNEAESYEKLLRQGGIPCHERTGSEHQGCPKSDICHFWANETDQWWCFDQQYTMWARFLSFQRRQREQSPAGFNDYRHSLLCSLQRAGVDFSRLTKRELFHPDLALQSKAMTWLEYFSFTYTEAEVALVTIRTDSWYWDTPWTNLVTSNLLTASELNRIRNMVGAIWMKPLDDDYDGVIPPDAMESRMKALGTFMKASRVAREAIKDMQRYNVLLRWILQNVYRMRNLDVSQIQFNMYISPEPFIDTASLELARPITTIPKCLYARPQKTRVVPSFRKFMRLPTEIRRMIWLAALPQEPIAHYFEVVNKSSPSRFDQWSPKRFGIRATSKYDSEYHTVHRLVASCRDARHFVWCYYRYKQWPPPHPDEYLHGFRTFDWIPESDLIVLRFPPETGALPVRDAIALGVGPTSLSRNVAIMISKGMVDEQLYGTDGDIFAGDARPEQVLSRVGSIPQFLSELCKRGSKLTPETETLRGGISKLYLLLEGYESSGCIYDYSQTWMLPSGRMLNVQTGEEVDRRLMKLIEMFSQQMFVLSNHDWTIQILSKLSPAKVYSD